MVDLYFAVLNFDILFQVLSILNDCLLPLAEHLVAFAYISELLLSSR